MPPSPSRSVQADWEPVLDILRCPATGQALRLRAAASGELPAPWLQMGERFGVGPPPAVLETADGAIAYPLWPQAAGLLAELGVPRGASTPALGGTGAFAGERLQNTRFYDEFGWIEREEGVFNDALAFEDMREVTAFYRRPCYRRVNRHLTGGRYLLDCASGAVQIPDYVGYSKGFDKRLCVDLSFAGLLQARRRLGEHAVCILGDVTALPLRDGCADNFISLHTVYHVPAGEQSRAIAELYRALRPGGTGVIVYSWGSASAIYRLGEALREGLERRGWMRRAAPRMGLETDLGLYFHAHDYDWYRREIAARYDCRLRIWRSVDKRFMESFARTPLSARLVLWPLFMLEELLPWLFGRYGLIPMFVLRKPAVSPAAQIP